MSGLQRALEAGVAEAGIPGAVALVADRQGVRFSGAAGQRAADDARPMAEDAIFWWASMTKAVTSVAALQQVEDGRLDLDAPIADLLPRARALQVLDGFDAEGRPRLRPARRPVTLRHLLTHTSGMGYDFCSADILRARGDAPALTPGSLASIEGPLLFEPGEGWAYGVSTDWAGLAVEAAAGAPLESVLRARIFEPLGMADTHFAPPEAKAGRLAAMHARAPEGPVVAIPSPAAAFAGGEYASGGAGLLGTGADYLRFLRALLAGGVLDGTRILSEAGVAALAANQIGALRAGALVTTVPHLARNFDLFPGQPTGWSLAFLINHAPVAGGRSAGSLAWAGIANTHYWIDPAAGVAGLYLAQLLPFGDEKLMAAVAAFERAAYAELGKV